MSDVLILNKSWMPISVLPLSVISWRHAIRLQFLEKIQPIEFYEDWVIRSEHLSIKVPAVAVSTEQFNYKKAVKFSRYNLFLRDLFQCAYCDECFDFNDLTIDHVIPRKLGGKTTFENCVTSCYNCNSKKGHKLIKPKRPPFKPDYWHLVQNYRRELPVTIKHESWLQYLGIDISELNKNNKIKYSNAPKFKFKE
jgi:5-methylcytosine-specific restriction endonuclease McrA